MNTHQMGSARRFHPVHIFALLVSALVLAAWACITPPADNENTNDNSNANINANSNDDTNAPDCTAQGKLAMREVDHNGNPASTNFTLVHGDTLALRGSGQAILRFGAGNNFTLYAPKTANGPVEIKKWNGTKEVSLAAGGGYVEQVNTACKLTSVAVGEITLIPAGTAFVFAYDAPAHRASVAVYDGAVRVAGSDASSRLLQNGEGAVFEYGAWSYNFAPPDLETALDNLRQGLDLENQPINGVSEDVIVTEAPPVPETILEVWTFWSADDPAIPELERRFEAAHSGVNLEFRFFAPGEMLDQMRVATAAGSGPDLWIYSHNGGGQFIEQKLAAGLQDFPINKIFDSIDQRARQAVTYNDIPIGIPLVFKGVVLYRNQKIVPEPQYTLDGIIAQSQAIREASGGRVEGMYFEKGFYFVGGSLYGQGGTLMGDDGRPAFATEAGAMWLEMIGRFGEGGPVSHYDDKDLERFAAGEVGWIVDGTWNMQRLADALGEDVLKIDPWPTYGSGRMGGFLEVEALYLNPQIRSEKREAAWALMSFLASPEAQQILHDTRHIPVSIEIGITDPLIQQMMVAFGDNTVIPTLPTLEYYWEPLDEAIQSSTDYTVELRPSFMEALGLAARRINDKIGP